MTDDHKRLADELFARICRCLEFDDLDVKFVVHQTPGKWLDMTVVPVRNGDGHIVFDLKKLLGVFEGNYFAGALHLAEDHKVTLTGQIEGTLFQVTFRSELEK